MASPSCSHWWHAPIYILIILASLSLLSISYRTSPKSQIPRTQNPSPPSSSSSPPSIAYLQTKASRALRNSGFHYMANLVQVSSDLLPPFESTVFAITDRSFSNLSLSQSKTKDLLSYHTVPAKHSIEDLLKKPIGTCIETLLYTKNLVITKIDGPERSVHINGVAITHPNLFLEGHNVIHGVGSPFNSIPIPLCDPNSGQTAIPWNQILSSLSSNGFVSFSISLHSVLDGIVRDFGNLKSVTIFAPPGTGFAYVVPNGLNFVRVHILPGRFTHGELYSMPENSTLPTLMANRSLRIGGGVVDGVEVTAPDVVSADGFVIHGVARAFGVVEVSSKFS